MSYAKGLAPVAVLGVVAFLLVSCSIRTTADGGPSNQDVAHGLNARGPSHTSREGTTTTSSGRWSRNGTPPTRPRR